MRKNDKVFIVNNLDTLFYIDCKRDKRISFGFNKNDNYSIDFIIMQEDENDIINNIITQIIFDKDLTTWKINQEDVNDEGYYYSYSYNIYNPKSPFGEIVICAGCIPFRIPAASS